MSLFIYYYINALDNNKHLMVIIDIFSFCFKKCVTPHFICLAKVFQIGGHNACLYADL